MWPKKHEETFQAIKGMLSSDQVLAHYDPILPLSLATNVSPYGIGADDGERLIAYVSQTLTPAEQKYVQVGKEALGLDVGVFFCVAVSLLFLYRNGEGVWFMTTIYYSTCLIHDVIIAVMSCTHAQWCLDRVLCSVELIIDWIVVPCSVSIVSRMSRSTPLPQVVSNDITGDTQGTI